MAENTKSVIDSELVEAMSQRLIAERSLMNMADLYKLFADESRLKILYLLHRINLIKQYNIIPSKCNIKCLTFGSRIPALAK